MADEQAAAPVHHGAFWVMFEKTSAACVEAPGVTECIKLAEELRGDKVTQIRRLPYPAMPPALRVPACANRTNTTPRIATPCRIPAGRWLWFFVTIIAGLTAFFLIGDYSEFLYYQF